MNKRVKKKVLTHLLGEVEEVVHCNGRRRRRLSREFCTLREKLLGGESQMLTVPIEIDGEEGHLYILDQSHKFRILVRFEVLAAANQEFRAKVSSCLDAHRRRLSSGHVELGHALRFTTRKAIEDMIHKGHL